MFDGWYGEQCATGKRAGHSLCPLESCNEGELCPHAVHMALRMEDGVEADAPNSRGGCRRGMEWREPAQQRTENPSQGGKGCRKLANRLESRRDSHQV